MRPTRLSVYIRSTQNLTLKVNDVKEPKQLNSNMTKRSIQIIAKPI